MQKMLKTILKTLILNIFRTKLENCMQAIMLAAIHHKQFSYHLELN